MKQVRSDKWVCNEGGWLHHPPSVSVPLDGHLSGVCLFTHRDVQPKLEGLPSRKYTPGKGDKGDLGLIPGAGGHSE